MMHLPVVPTPGEPPSRQGPAAPRGPPRHVEALTRQMDSLKRNLLEWRAERVGAQHTLRQLKSRAAELLDSLGPESAAEVRATLFELLAKHSASDLHDAAVASAQRRASCAAVEEWLETLVLPQL